MTIYCDCKDCKYNNGEWCTKNYISIKETFYADAPAVCDYYEKEEHEE